MNKKIYTWGSKFSERNYTFYDLKKLKGIKKLIQTTATNKNEAYASAEAGIDMLLCKSPNIKSVRSGKVNIAESYAVEKDGEIYLVNSHIPIYKQASFSNHNPYSERKLLLNRKEINKIIGKINEDGFSLVPTKMYFKKGKAKIEIAVAKGKKQYDKRHSKKTKDWNREKARYFRKSS